jgi:hypothetical protein
MFPVLPEHLFDGTTIPADHPIRDHAVGTLGTADRSDTGVVFSTAARRLELIAPPDDPGSAVRDLEAGRIDGIIDLPTALRERVAADDSLQLRTYDPGELWTLDLRADRPPLADPRVRHALDLLLDRAALQLLAEPGGEVNWLIDLISGPFPQIDWRNNRSIPLPARDPAQAEALLLQSGWERTDAGWSAGGRPVALTMSISASAMSSVVDDVPVLAETLASQLSAAGIRTVVTSDPDADLILRAFPADMLSEPAELLASFRCDDPERDRLVSDARRAATDTAEQQAWMAVHRHLAQTRPALFLWSAQTRSAWRAGIHPVISPRSYWSELDTWRFSARSR